MRFARLSVFLGCAVFAFSQQRDLKIEPVEGVPAPRETVRRVIVPRSYAVIVGISRFPNLPRNQQLQFAERDVQSIYTILISPEGGNVKAENAHVLTGEKATLAALRREIDEWLPGVAREDDRILIYFAGLDSCIRARGILRPLTSIGTTSLRPASLWMNWGRRSDRRFGPSTKSCSPMPVTAARLPRHVARHPRRR
jgi:hypothetical protein